MPVSSKSYIHKPADYVTPVDLNLLGKVLQFKQAQFDSGTQKIQSTIDSIGALDVVKDTDRQYLTAKLNNLVETVNNIGGADFSDPNITNQIAGLSSQIYGDDKIINAVGNTKKFRYVQSYYKDLKEKKPKDYNPANEWYDMDKFSGWLNDGQVGTSAGPGSGQVTPYNDYQTAWDKLYKGMTANMKTEITDKGLMYRTDTHKYISPNQVADIAAKMLTPVQRQQLGIEGRYTYNNLPIGELSKAYDAKLYKQVSDVSSQIEDYKTKLKGATALSDQEKYQKLIAEEQAGLNKLLAPVRKNADQIKEKLYIDEKMKGLQSRYAYTQSTSKLQAASDKMFKLKYEMDKAEFAYKQQNDVLDREVSLAKDGLMWSVDAFGHRTIVRNPNTVKLSSSSTNAGKAGADDYSDIPGLDNSGENQKIEYTKETLDQRKTDLVSTNDQLFKKFIQDLGRKKGLSDVIITDLTDDGVLQAKVSPEMEKMANDMMNSWQAMARGEKINYDVLDPLFKGFAAKYQENIKEIEGIDQYYSNIDKQILEKYSLTPQSLSAYKEYTKAVEDLNYSKSSSVAGAAGSIQAQRELITNAERNLANVVNKLSNGRGITGLPFNMKAIKEYEANRNNERDVLLSAAGIKYNLPTVTATDDKNKNLSKIIATNAGTLQWYSEDGKPEAKEILNPDNIDVISKGYSLLKTDKGNLKQPVFTFKYKTGSKPEDFQIRKVPLNPQQAQMLGFGTEVQDLTGYNLGLRMNGEVKDVLTTSGKDYDLKYDIVKYNVENQNDSSVFLRVKKGDNTISLYNKPFPTYEHAVQFMESATKQKTANDAYKFLDDLSK